MKKLMSLVVILVLVVSVGAVFTLSGCKTTGTTETTAAATEGTTAAETTAAETTAAETTAAGEPKTIVYWTMWNQGEAMYEEFEKLVAEYEAMHPEINIEVSYVGREMMSKLSPALAAGEVVDIVEDEEFHIKPTLGVTDQLLVLDEALNATRFEGDITWKENFVTGSIANENAVFIPYQVYTSGLSYNKKLWRDKGWVIPKTWDELLAICETIKATGLAPLAQDGMVDRYNYWWYREIMERFDGPDSIIAAIEDKTGESWGNPNFLLGLQMIRNLHEKGYFIDGIDSFVWPEGQGYFGEGETAFIFCGSWLAFEMKDQVADDWEWGFSPFPTVTGGKGALTDMVLLSSGWSILKNSKVGPECIEFLKYLTSVASSQRYGDASNMTLSVKEVKSPSVQADVGVALANATNTYVWDEAPYYGDYTSNITLKNFQDAFFGIITPEQFIEKMKTQTKEYWANK